MPVIVTQTPVTLVSSMGASVRERASVPVCPVLSSSHPMNIPRDTRSAMIKVILVFMIGLFFGLFVFKTKPGTQRWEGWKGNIFYCAERLYFRDMLMLTEEL